MTREFRHVFARASLVPLIAEYFWHTKYTKITKYGESLRPRTSGVLTLDAVDYSTSVTCALLRFLRQISCLQARCKLNLQIAQRAQPRFNEVILRATRHTLREK